MAVPDTLFFLNLFKAIRDFNKDPEKIRTTIGDKVYFKKDVVKLLKRLPHFKTYWNISNEEDLIRKVYTDFWVERDKNLAFLISRPEPILPPEVHTETKTEPQTQPALSAKTIPPINPLSLIPQPPEVLKQAAANTTVSAQIKTKKLISRIKIGSLFSYLGKAVFGEGTASAAPTPPSTSLAPSVSPTFPAPLPQRSQEKAYPIGTPAYKKFEVPSFLKNIASSLQIKAGRAISRYGRLKFITSLVFGGAGGGLAALSGVSPMGVLASSALGFGFPNFITSRVGGTLLRGGGGLAFKAGSKAALTAAGPVGWGIAIASSGTLRKIVKWVAVGIGVFILFFLIQNPFGLSKGTGLLLLPELGEAAPIGDYPPQGPPPTNSSLFSCPVAGGAITCGSIYTPSNSCGHCDSSYISQPYYANLCSQYPYNALAIDVGGAAGSPVYLPYIGQDSVDWYYIRPEPKSSGEMIKGFTATVGTTKYYLQLHHLKNDGSQVNLSVPIKSGQVAGQICTNSDCDHTHIQLANGSALWQINTWLDAGKYFECRII